MFRLLIFTAVLIAVFLAAIGATRFMGRQPQLLNALFTNPDGTPCAQPCLFGIHPGKTSRDEATALLKAHPLTSNLDIAQDAEISVHGSGQDILTGKDILIEEDALNPTVVKGIHIETFESGGDEFHPQFASLTTLGELVAMYGAPDYVFIDDPDTVTFLFPRHGIRAVVVTEHSEIHPNRYPARLDGKVFRLNITEPFELEPPTSQYGWCGFVTHKCSLGGEHEPP
jgi:hypothetical protein